MKYLSAILALLTLLTVGLACSDSGEQTNAQTNAANSAEKKGFFRRHNG